MVDYTLCCIEDSVSCIVRTRNLVWIYWYLGLTWSLSVQWRWGIWMQFIITYVITLQCGIVGSAVCSCCCCTILRRVVHEPFKIRLRKIDFVTDVTPCSMINSTVSQKPDEMLVLRSYTSPRPGITQYSCWWPLSDFRAQIQSVMAASVTRKESFRINKDKKWRVFRNL